MNQVILYLTNSLDEISVENYLKLKNEINNKYDLIILFHKKFKICDYSGTNIFTINGFENLYYKYIS